MTRMRKRARVLAWLWPAVAVLALALILGARPTPAHAVTGIAFSRDGSSWGSALNGPLFSSSIRWVPGDVRTERFYVRNDSNLIAKMDVAVIATSVQELIDTGDLAVAVRIGNGDWQATSVAGTHDLASRTVNVGESYPVEVRVSFLAEATNSS